MIRDFGAFVLNLNAEAVGRYGFTAGKDIRTH